MDEIDKQIIVILQDGLPLCVEPFRQIAIQLGISEQVVLERINRMRTTGVIRKFGAVLRHRQIGYVANALCAWRVLPEHSKNIGEQMAAYQFVTHCYLRQATADWPYNFYTMIHGQSRSECQQLATKLACETGVVDYVLLFSVKEWKKASMRYF